MDWLARRLLDWFDHHGRTDLPWQQGRDAYQVWVSEIMLQQTQVATVIPYYQRFMARFPDVGSLAAAELDEVLLHWSGLGYYARGRNLHRAARCIVEEHGGRLPADVAALQRLPGIGRSTAGAIAAIAFGQRAAILDGNVKRVLARFHRVEGYPGSSGPQRELWAHAEAHTPAERIGDYTQAIMDLGATLCVRARPRCDECPLRARCEALAGDVVAEYPQRRPKRRQPVRAARMFVVTDPRGHCLLEQRPLDGIWGGLWTPPQRAADTEAAELCRELAIPEDTVAASRAGERFRHTFTHFHLDIEPLFLTLDRPVLAAADADHRCWAEPARPGVGLAAPAARLLATLETRPADPPAEDALP